MNNLSPQQKAILDLEYDLNNALFQSEILFGVRSQEAGNIRKAWKSVVDKLPEYSLSLDDTYAITKAGE